jgi:AraC family transcriptional regulator, regulatory protein of adaptative response / DNA-3-methyladenine glycosylase II
MGSIANQEFNGYLGQSLRSQHGETFMRAYETRDPRFDGRFFIAVRTTGVFCRPVCSARTPKRANVTFFPSSAAAFAAGYRPCLRCRPERAPAVRGQESAGAALVSRALEAIEAGALNENSLDQLSARIGVTSRHLRRLFEEHLGASPIAVAQMRRLLFAKQLIEESTLPLTQVAFAAGYGSVRRFNASLSAAYGRAPGSLRRRDPATDSASDGTVRLRLGTMETRCFRQLLSFYRTRAFAGVESATEIDYLRSIRMGETSGFINVKTTREDLMLTCDFPHIAALPAIVARVKRMFDLDAPAAAIYLHLQRDRKLKPALQKNDMHVPCAWDAYELAVRAVLGQQISVAAATTLAARLVARLGEPLAPSGSYAGRLRYAFPTPATLGAAKVAELTALGLVRARAEALIALGRHVGTDPAWRERYLGLDAFTATFCALPGIGPWTAQYVAMRGFADPDAFPSGDLGLLRAARRLGIANTPKELLTHAERWRPWRAYAAQSLWNDLTRRAT